MTFFFKVLLIVKKVHQRPTCGLYPAVECDDTKLLVHRVSFSDLGGPNSSATRGSILKKNDSFFFKVLLIVKKVHKRPTCGLYPAVECDDTKLLVHRVSFSDLGGPNSSATRGSILKKNDIFFSKYCL